jgi:hypothetical protein
MVNHHRCSSFDVAVSGCSTAAFFDIFPEDDKNENRHVRIAELGVFMSAADSISLGTI